MSSWDYCIYNILFQNLQNLPWNPMLWHVFIFGLAVKATKFTKNQQSNKIGRTWVFNALYQVSTPSVGPEKKLLKVPPYTDLSTMFIMLPRLLEQYFVPLLLDDLYVIWLQLILYIEERFGTVKIWVSWVHDLGMNRTPVLQIFQVLMWTIVFTNLKLTSANLP